MNLYHIKLTDNQKSALEHLFSLDIEWNKSEFEKAWNELRVQVREAAQHVAIINALQDSGCNCNRKSPTKYDPCRKLRKGDIVEPRELYGRKHKALNYNYKYEVLEDEDKDGIVKVEYFDGGFTCTSYIPFYWFKLVTPVEELEPYKIAFDDVTQNWNVIKDGVVLCSYKGTKHPHAEKSAEAERDRL
ncbi:hypothetical protein, partial [Fibrobacter sp.]|uniref:hypothetical protein n=1 Tax=Fibrobacter sp. TaxID=35828 RepID=UPI0025BDAF4B